MNVKEGDEEPEKTEEVDFSEIEDFLSNVEKQSEYKPGLPLSISEKDAIKQQIMRNWTFNAGAKAAQDIVVSLKISVAKDGSVRNVKIDNMIRYSSDSFFRAMVDSAVRAVRKTSPLRNLPIEKYDVKDGWREMVINFDPSEMMY